VAAALLLLWTLTTLAWWAFAFMPLPARPPAWLTAARHACFGAVESGWPSADGWILLVAAPATLLAVIVVVWGRDAGAALRRAGRSWPGRALLVAVAVAAAVEGGWVARRLATAAAVEAWPPTPAGEDEPLPADYPRRAAPVRDFTLTDQHGARVTLGAFRGRPVVLSFVFAHCQTLCPFLVQTLKRAAPETDVLLVTLDPWRDTPGALPGLARRWEMPPRFHVLSARRADDVLDVVGAGVGRHRPPRPRLRDRPRRRARLHVQQPARGVDP
jgi:cytochrome oxidase Cu insertion factor (SCO1/SenC/PrrC family)